MAVPKTRRGIQHASVWRKVRLTAATLASVTVLVPCSEASNFHLRSGGNWHVVRNWTPFGIPREADTATIDGRSARLDRETESLAQLTMQNEASLTTHGETLNARSGEGRIDVSNQSTLTVEPHLVRSGDEDGIEAPTGFPGVDASELRLSNSSNLVLNDGLVLLRDVNPIEAREDMGHLLNNESTISGNGHIRFRGFATGNDVLLDNRGGTITAEGGLLRVSKRNDHSLQSGLMRFDSQSVLNATDGISELRFETPIAPDRFQFGRFGGTLNIGGGNTVAFSGSRVSLGGTSNVGDGSSDNGQLGSGAGRLVADAIENRGRLNLSNGVLTVAEFSQLSGGSLVVEGAEASDIIAGSAGRTSIRLGGATTLNGDLNLDGDTVVSRDALISGSGILTVASGHSMHAGVDGELPTGQPSFSFDVPVISEGSLTPGIPCFSNGCDTTTLGFDSLAFGELGSLHLSVEGKDFADFDRILANQLALQGSLAIGVGASDLQAGDRLHIIESTSRTGEFDNVQISQDPDDNNGYRVVYEGNDVFLEVVEPIILGSRSPFDFNHDGELDAADIDLLSEEVLIHADISDPRGHDPTFDVDGDGLITGADRVSWIEEVKQTRLGDADLNGFVEFVDFLALSQSFGSESGGWAQGDFDGDTEIGFPDFLILSQNFGSSGPIAASVPEPSICSILLGCVASIRVFRRRSRLGVR